MKKIRTILAASAIILAANSAVAEPVKYAVESNHAFVVWSANHFGFSNQMGKFSDIEGGLIFDEANPEKSSVEVSVKTSGLHTGLAKFDQHLKSADFFNVEKFPVAKFVSKKIKVTGKNTAAIEGDLTLVGVTKPVTLNAKFNKSGINPISQKQTVGFSATAVLKRSDFKIIYALPGVADEVKLAIELEANR